MFEHILVPTDFSDVSKHALEIAANIVLRDKGRISLLHVIEIIKDTTVEEFRDFYLELERRAWAVMDRMVETYQNSLIQVHPKVVYGRRVEKILEFVSRHDIDLIVMHSHRIRPEDPVQGWGTISYKVGVLSQCPVMLVK
jgi:universal stress protein A